MLTTEARHLPNRDSHSAFKVFVAVANATIDVERDVRARNLALRTVLSNTLQDDEFVVDIVERALIRLVNDGDNWTNPPLHVDPARGFAVNLIYWPAGVSCAPHQHQHWTLTGVVYGDIITTTYLRDPAMRIDRRFEGRPGDVGYIVPPCIHNVGNPYRCPALTIHLFGGDPVNESGATARLNDATVWFEDDDTTAFIPNPQRTAAATLEDALEAVLRLPARLPGMKWLGALAVLVVSVSVPVFAITSWLRHHEHPSRHLPAGETALGIIRDMKYQTGTSDCGAATIYDFAVLVGRSQLGAAASARVDTGEYGATVDDISNAIGAVGFAVDVQRAPIGNARRYPSIALLQQHYILLIALHKNEIEVFDPSHGHIAISRASVRARAPAILLLPRKTP